jgi:hypothetical protein
VTLICLAISSQIICSTWLHIVALERPGQMNTRCMLIFYFSIPARGLMCDLASLLEEKL